MDPDLEDPNNHVPPIAPGDDWDDLDEISEKSRMGLPPRKADRGLPPKKESRSPQVSRHAPLLKLEQEGQYNPLKPSKAAPPKKTGLEQEDAAVPEQPEIPTRRKAAKKTAKKTAAKASKRAGAAKKKAQGLVEPRTMKSKPEEPELVPMDTEEAADARISLPPAPTSKRLRVNEIDPSHDPLAGRAVRRMPAVQTAPAAAAAAAEGGQVSPQPTMQKRRRFSRGERADWGEKSGGSSLKWMLLTGLGVVAIVVLAVVLSQLPDGKGNRSQDQSLYSQMTPDKTKPADESDDLRNLEILTNSQEEAKSIFAIYASAENPEDFIPYAYAAERNSELIKKEWKPLGMKAGWTADDSVWTVFDKENRRYGILEGTLADFTRFSAFFRQEAGVLKMDWKASTGYSSAGFASLKKGEGDGSETRAWVSMADFYTFAFPEEKYRCYRLMSKDGHVNLWGYVPIGGGLDEEFLNLFQPSQITGEVQADAQVILRLGPGPVESLPDQWLIDGLLAKSWLGE
ncbi:hypothetical protein HZ994_05595 [Akkermansiaceae bacterium]|nr:hypothetical protein HZ994_05595 [Akkermansiaceae bacterium]